MLVPLTDGAYFLQTTQEHRVYFYSALFPRPIRFLFIYQRRCTGLRVGFPVPFLRCHAFDSSLGVFVVTPSSVPKVLPARGCPGPGSAS